MSRRAPPPFLSTHARRGAALTSVVVVVAAIGAAGSLLLIDLEGLARRTAPAAPSASRRGSTLGDRVTPDPVAGHEGALTDPRRQVPADNDRHAHLLHARWYAAWHRATEATRRLAACRDLHRSLRAPCSGERHQALVRAAGEACRAARRAQAVYLDHVAPNRDAHPA